MELLIRRAAAEDKAAARRQQRTPVGHLVVVRPHLLARVDVPRLYFADVIGAGPQLCAAALRAREARSLLISHRNPRHRRTQIVIGGDVHHPRAWTVGGRRPVLAAVQAGTVLRFLAGPGLLVGVDVGAPGFGIEGAEDGLVHVWL